MSWLTSALKLIPLLTPAVDAVRGWFAPKREPELSADATAQRQGTASGAAANYSSKATERTAHTSLEAKLDARLPR